MIRAVLFDMDGVLLDTETLGLQAMTEIARELEHPIDRAFYLTTLGVPNAECGHVYRNALGQDFPYEVAMKRFQQYFFDYNRTRSLPRKPGLMDCLTGLRQRGLRIAQVTSTIRPLVESYFAAMPDVAACFDGLSAAARCPRASPRRICIWRRRGRSAAALANASAWRTASTACAQ